MIENQGAHLHSRREAASKKKKIQNPNRGRKDQKPLTDRSIQFPARDLAYAWVWSQSVCAILSDCTHANCTISWTDAFQTDQTGGGYNEERIWTSLHPWRVSLYA